MESEERPLTPGTSYVAPPLNSAQNPVTPAFLNSTLQQSSCSSDVSDVLTPAEGSQGHDGVEGTEQTAGSEPGEDPARSAQRRFMSSAFPSSLSWDSDSEKETLDEEELQHFSNPHGLAAHSPGSPSSGPRIDCEDDKEPGKLQHLEHEAVPSVSGEVCNEIKESTTREEPNTSQLGPKELGGSHDCNISVGAEIILGKLKPNDTSLMEEDTDKRDGKKRLEGEDTKEHERDVYTFTGDSDPESSPPAQWTHCTLFQRCRKKRVLLKPFPETLPHTFPEAATQASTSPQRSATTELAPPTQSGGSYHFDDFRMSLLDDSVVIRDAEDKLEEHEDCSVEHGTDVFTCVECSIYFKKQVHLKEHMVEHCRTAQEGSECFQCPECGWDLPDSVVLADHQNRHQESRVKILSEIEKLKENENVKERPETKLEKQETLQKRCTPGKVLDTCPPLYQAPMSTSDEDQVALKSNTPQSSFGTTFQPRAVLYRRRFVCTQCNFSTRTSQALANHTKTHMRKKNTLVYKSNSSAPDPLSSSSPLCSSQVITKRQRKQAHSGPDSIFSHSSYDCVSSGTLDSNCVSDSISMPTSCQTKGLQGIDISENAVATQVVLGYNRNRRFSRRARFGFRPNETELPGCEAEQDKNPENDPEKVAVKERTAAGSDPDECSENLSVALSPEMRTSLKEKTEKEKELDNRVFVLRRSNRITSAIAEIESDDDDDDIDDERVRHFLSGNNLEDVEDEIDEVSEALKSVERKCPYCPDRFHNGIGLANHVRGHLNRVGVSYNVRHFISPEEVNAIEKRFSYQKKKKKGDGEAEEEVEPEHLAGAGLSSSPKKTRLLSIDEEGLSSGEDEEPKVHGLKCELSGAQFETRRELSSHGRSHMRPREFNVFECDAASVDHLCQSAKERTLDVQLRSPHMEPHLAKSSSLFDSENHKDKEHDEEGEDLDEKPIPLSILTKAVKGLPSPSCSTPTPSPGHSPIVAHACSPSSVVRKAPISSLLPASSPLRSAEHKTGGMKSSTSNHLTSTTISASKPIWAPHENDAPLNLTLEVEPSKDIVCQLCGAWFETRKGLSSHARAHLRHFGVEYSESKGSPITLLNQLMESEDFKHKNSEFQLDTESRGIPNMLSSPKKATLPSSSPSLLYKVTTAGGGSNSKATSPSSFGPPAKRLKSSSMQVFRLSSGELMALAHSEPTKEIGCEFCGEFFENRKGLSSHARSHLRQMGITEWSVNGSPIDTLREIISRRGLPCARPLKPRKTPPPISSGHPQSPLSTCSSPSALPSRLPFPCSSSPPQPPSSKSNSTPMSSSGLILKLKPEPMQLEVTAPEAMGSSGGFSDDPLSSSWHVSDSALPLNLAMSREAAPTRDIRCEFCGEYFENRKGLSSHARSHLRQMGVTEWTVNGSPIDTLREIMHKRGVSVSSHSERVKKEDAKSPSWGNTTKSSDGLCMSGFQSSKLYKSPLSMLSSGSRLSKQGPSSVGPLSIPSSPKIVRISPLGKQSEEAEPMDTSNTVQHQRTTFSPLSHNFPLRKKPSPDKHVRKDPSCELCGFYFENRKALASHARAHLRQFGVTEWCVNGSPIETLSAWIHSRPQKVLEMHRSYMQSSRPTSKRKSSSPLPASTDSDHSFPFSSQKASSSSSSSSSQWSSALAVNLVRPLSRDLSQRSFKASEDEAGPTPRGPNIRPYSSSPSPSQLFSSLPLQAQVARSELNVRLPRGFERRPLKHPSCVEGTERDSGPPKPLRTSTVPALVPKPPAYPLVKLVGKFYNLKCRFCEVEFHGPLSVQEDWIRHLQQHILKMNYSKPVESKAACAEVTADDPAPVHRAPAAGTSSTISLNPTVTCAIAANNRSSEPPAELVPSVTEIVKLSEELLAPAPIPLPAQVM
ncbi:protein Wiz isoform X2 [Syngnathoides biaculeatus]|uniref:protein Wiz isoform X2 n=1 Tax=Syngnathoides biaculeatus TaxID=300417 RepID=UPI002ADD6F99|nr:protein Wiz isoform X2 [Syngnathoides biaculeatus]